MTKYELGVICVGGAVALGLAVQALILKTGVDIDVYLASFNNPRLDLAGLIVTMPDYGLDNGLPTEKDDTVLKIYGFSSYGGRFGVNLRAYTPIVNDRYMDIGGAIKWVGGRLVIEREQNLRDATSIPEIK